MKDLTTLLPELVAKSTGNDPIAQVRSEDLTVDQKSAIKYFYARLERIYLAEYRRQLPDLKTERASKSEFGALIMDIPLTTMERGFDALHELLGDPESTYRFMKIDPIVQLIRNGGNASGNASGMYKYFDQTNSIEDITSKEKRKTLGRKECSKLLGMFDDD